MTYQSPPQPFLTFYDAIGFAPTRQNHSLAATLTSRRSFLYRSLGISEIAVRGSDVIEFGPGSGENSEVLSAQNPRNYTFVDGSPAVLKNLQDRFGNSELTGESCVTEFTFIHSNIQTFTDDGLHDIAICEGVLPMQMEPREMARNVMKFVRPGGCVVFTCFDSVSAFSEIARRFIASSVFGSLQYSPELVSELVDFFTPDFINLPGMSRLYEDWVLDSIINPWFGEFFSLEDALEVSQDSFALLGTSPRIIQDWRWYKDPSALDENSTLNSAISSYRRNIHSLVDARVTGQPTQSYEDNSSLIDVTSTIAKRVRGHISYAEPYETNQFGADVQRMIDTTGSLDKQTRESLQALVNWASSSKPSDLTLFRELWGRGQQYISLVRLD